METFFTIGFGIIIAFSIVCIVQYIGNEGGNVFFDGFYGNTSIGEKLREVNKKEFKEEQKQHLTNMMKQDEELGLYGEVHGKQGVALTSDYIQNIGKEITPEQIWNKEKLEGIKKLIQEHKDGK